MSLPVSLHVCVCVCVCVLEVGDGGRGGCVFRHLGRPCHCFANLSLMCACYVLIAII